jgi:hypothetical protein
MDIKKYIFLLIFFCSTAHAQTVVRITQESQHPLRHRAQFIMTNPTSFDGLLSTSDTSVQAALNTLDDVVVMWSVPVALEYLAEYVDCDAIYEGWALWYTTTPNSQSDLVWRIAKNTFVDGAKTYTEYAGTGIFDKAWSLRTSYFGITRSGEYYLLTDSTHFLLTGVGTKLRTF